VVIVNRRLASQFWPGEDAVGHVLRYTEGATTTAARVVGVGPDLVYEEFGEETPQSQLNVYVPYAAAPWRTQAVLVNAAANPAAVSDSVRAAVRAVDPGFAVYDVMTMIDRRAYNHWSARFIGRAFLVFAAATLLLACIGAYGIAAYAVARRRREIGIRMAVGATRARVLRLFIATGARLAAGGLIVGLPLALITARMLEHELFRVSPWSAGVWGLPPAILALAVVAACYFPARRATLIDPATVLKTD
jgi:putative ABC transport system permease protein